MSRELERIRMSRELERIRSDAVALAESLRVFAEHHDSCAWCSPTHDGLPRLRPHTLAGWWQVWSGGVCVALLEPEDVAPLHVGHGTEGPGGEVVG